MNKCEHKYIYVKTIFSKISEGSSRGMTYKRRDEYVCEKCLNEEVKTKEVWSLSKPDWWQEDSVK